MAFLVQLTILVLVASLSYGEVSITPEVSDLLIKNGAAQELKCSSSSTSNQPYWDFPNKKEQDGNFRIQGGYASGKGESVLEILNFTVPGDYVCQLSDGSETFTDTISLILVAETKVEPTYQYGNKSAKLSCSITGSGSNGLTVEKVTWMKGDTAVSALPDSARFTTAEANSLTIDEPKLEDIGVYTAVIKVENIETPYKCEVSFKDEIVEITPTKVEPEFIDDSKPVVLSCNIDVKRKIKNVEWLQNNTLITKLDGSDRFEVYEENNTVIIDAPKRKDSGLYIARFDIEGLREPYDCEVMFTAAPNVLAFTKSKNLIEKDKMELQCKVEGFPKAVVTWLKDDVALNVSQDNRIELHTLEGYKNARLVIKNIEFSDEGEYACHAYSSYFNESNTKTITVRVKDKLAALWPFLGIVCEVIILCTIIFIYEKRRNKRAEQEENKAQEADGPSMEKKDGLRHRGTSGNPGA